MADATQQYAFLDYYRDEMSYGTYMVAIIVALIGHFPYYAGSILLTRKKLVCEGLWVGFYGFAYTVFHVQLVSTKFAIRRSSGRESALVTQSHVDNYVRKDGAFLYCTLYDWQSLAYFSMMLLFSWLFVLLMRNKYRESDRFMHAFAMFGLFLLMNGRDGYIDTWGASFLARLTIPMAMLFAACFKIAKKKDVEEEDEEEEGDTAFRGTIGLWFLSILFDFLASFENLAEKPIPIWSIMWSMFTGAALVATLFGMGKRVNKVDSVWWKPYELDPPATSNNTSDNNVIPNNVPPVEAEMTSPGNPSPSPQDDTNFLPPPKPSHSNDLAG